MCLLTRIVILIWMLLILYYFFKLYSSKHVFKTSWQDSVEINSFQTLFKAENTVAAPQISLLKIEHSVACSPFVMCAQFGGSAFCRNGDSEF